MAISLIKQITFCKFRFWQKLVVTLLWLVTICALFLVGIVVMKAFLFYPDTEVKDFEGIDTPDFINKSKIFERAERLAGALHIPTISYEPDRQEKLALKKFHQYLEKNFPLIHHSQFVKKEVINEYSLLYTVEGTIPGKLPYLLASHLDVVPVEPKSWEVPPFSGNIINKTYIYGRGAMDDKSGVMGIMEALEYILEMKQQPLRSFFIAFGHDEEISGKRGAQEIAKVLRSRGITKLDFVIDEGFPVIENLIPGTEKKVAIVGVTEKGSLTLELSVVGTPGHSSIPPAESAIGILASAVSKLEHIHHPNLFGAGPELETFSYLAPYVTFWYRLLYSNLWLFSGLMAQLMEGSKVTRSFIRTTTAITKFNGGVKHTVRGDLIFCFRISHRKLMLTDNVVPPLATATINHRIHPAQKVAHVIKYDREIINDPRVRIHVKHSREAHPISSFGSSSLQYQLLAYTVKQIYDDVIVVPGAFVANTDTRWYLNFTTALYRFLPTVVHPSDLGRYHGNNERISISHYHQTVNFFYRIIKNSDLLIQKTLSSIMSKDREL